MLVAITGATGLVGTYTVKGLKAAGHRVRALVRRTSRRDHIAPYVDEWVVGEFYEQQAQAGLAAGAECIIHAAADWTALDSSPNVHITRNVQGSLQLLEAARQASVERFVFVSSGAVYHEILQDRKLDENHPTWPKDIYGAGKAAVEAFLKAYHYQFGMSTVAFRPVAIYGVDPILEKSHWIKLVRDVKAGKPISESGGGKIVHVQDVADALVYAVGDNEVSGKLFNLVDRHMYWQVAAEIAKELTGSPSAIEDRKGTGPKNTYDTRAAVEFYERHGNHVGIRRGLDGVREYINELLKLV
jgi:nucleoside-diphosphate-sugar epimerase